MEAELHQVCEEQITAAMRESKQAEVDPEDFPLGSPACNLGEECESCQ